MQEISVKKNDILSIYGDVKKKSHKSIEEIIQDIILKKPFGNVKFYIFSFLKNKEGQGNVKRYIWQSRLTKPDPVPGSSLYRVNPINQDEVEIVWILPHREAFHLFKKDGLFDNELIWEFCDQYLKDPSLLKRNFPDDLSDEQVRAIYRSKRRKR